MEWNDGEHVLAEGDCMMMRGPAGFPGRLYLTNERIFYEPTRLQRVLGVQSHFIPLKNITETERRALDGRVRIHARRQVLEFDGAGVRAVWERLQTELGEDTSSFRRDERVVADLPGEWFLGDRLAVGGQVLLTQRQVKFTPRAIERLLARDDLQVFFDEVESFKLEEGKHRIDIHLRGGAVHRLGGPAVGPIYAALVTARTRREVGLPADEGHFEVWSGELLRPPLSHDARFVLTSHHLFVVVDGALDALAGLPWISGLPLAKVDRIDRRGGVEKRLTVTTGDGSVQFHTERFDLFYDQLLLCAGEAASFVAPTALREGVGEALLGQILGPWAEIGLREQLGATVLLLSPALGTSPTGHSRRGFLLVGEEQIAFVPEEGPASGDGPWIFAIATMPRAVGGSLADEVRFVLKGGRYRFHCAGGVLTHRAFWESLGEVQAERERRRIAALPPGEEDEEDEEEEEPRERDSNRRTSYRMKVPIIDLEAVLGRRAPPEELASPAQPAAAAPSAPAPSAPSPSATAAGAATPVEDQPGSAGTVPGGEGPGASADGADPSVTEDAAPFQLWRLIDLSLGGAQIEASEAIPPATLLELKLGTAEELPAVRSLVAHVRKVRGKPLWRYGLRFEGNDHTVQQSVFDSWSELQRVDAALRHSEED